MLFMVLYGQAIDKDDIIAPFSHQHAPIWNSQQTLGCLYGKDTFF